ncbi:hypothetical protein FW774_12720 [Pedobacter sp. BS3]|uniref:hypothetical protein n=1 Tax=Pedobacter sp. BS3 TaxID=2567937 RepID=UPI0011ED7625|nr:hypothetical protein [Pedobacter sp. BS3]TZF83154.1 hypothetical protein FW774_12720 [Pedobacter sp. BS3]
MRIRLGIILFLVAGALVNSCYAQDFSKAIIKLSGSYTNLKSITLLFDDASIKLDGDGNISSFNLLNKGETGFNGESIMYYDQFANRSKIGKLKSVNSVNIDYYDIFDGDDLDGKVKSVGNTVIKYYDRFDRKEDLGKIKSLGNVNITYYDQFELSERTGKLKTIGNTTIDYYDRFDIDRRPGRVKSIEGKTDGVVIIAGNML